MVVVHFCNRMERFDASSAWFWTGEGPSRMHRVGGGVCAMLVAGWAGGGLYVGMFCVVWVCGQASEP